MSSTKQHNNKDYDFLLYRIEALEKRLDAMKSSNHDSELVPLLLKLLEAKTQVEYPIQTQQIQQTPQIQQAPKKTSDDPVLYDSLISFARRRTMS